MALDPQSWISTPYAGIYDLPQELIELIVDQICTDNEGVEAAQMLGAFRLASRWVNDIVSVRIFETIYLSRQGSLAYVRGGEEANDRVRRLLVLIQSNPAIATSVRTLHIHSKAQAGYRSYSIANWVVKSRHLPKLLLRLTLLRHFSLMSFSGELDLSVMSKDLDNSLSAVLQMPSLTSIELLNIENIYLGTIFYRSSNSSTATRKVQHRRHMNEISDTSTPFSLHSLTICPLTVSQQVEGLLNDVESINNRKHDIRSIDNLTLNVSSASLFSKPVNFGWQKILKNLGSDLKDITITSDKNHFYEHSLPFGEAFSYLRRTEKLLFRFLVGFAPSDAYYFSAGLPACVQGALRCGRPVPSIRTIHLHLLTDSDVRNWNKKWRLTEDWSMLETIIHTVYPNLQSLVLELQPSSSPHFDYYYTGNAPLSDEALDKDLREYLREFFAGLILSNPSVRVKVIAPTESIFMLN